MEGNYPKRSGQERGREDLWGDGRAGGAGVKALRRDRRQHAGAEGSLGWTGQWKGGVGRRKGPYNSRSEVSSVP